MLRILALAAQGVLAAFLLYELVVAAWGWARPRRPAATSPRHRFRVVVPAHNEEAVIGNVLGDLGAQTYPADLFEVVVIADRCSDGTVAKASGLATVVERVEGREGKGAAIDWLLQQAPLDGVESLVVLDADTRVPAELLGRFNDELVSGHDVMQAYLDVSNPLASPMATASAMTYWAGNRMVQHARSRLGWSADLGGTGMAFSARAMAALGGFGSGLTEDQDASARLVTGGFRVRWLHELRIRDEKPAAVGAAIRQRARWVAGKRRVARAQLWPLIAAAWRQRSWAPVDVALRLLNPGRSFGVLAAALLAVAAAVTGSDALFRWQVWGSLAGVLLVAPLAFLMRDGVSSRYLVRYPLVIVVAVLWLPIRIMSRLVGDRWARTPRDAELG
jgi:hypothetical protein